MREKSTSNPGLRLVALLLSAVMLAGCQAQQKPDAPPPPAGVGRSLVFDSAKLRQLRTEAGLDEGLAWYDARRDNLPYVEAGYQGPTFERTYSTIYDQYGSSNGQTRDYYRNYSRSYRVTESSR